MNERQSAEAIFDAFGRLSEFTALAHDLRLKEDQIQSVNQRRCGNCDHWMKTTCVPEKKHGQFKSCNSIACGAFVQDWSSKQLSVQFNAERDVISQKIAAMRAPRT